MTFEWHHLCAGYHQKRPVLRDVSFALGSGGIITLLGRNGCGKSTLLRTVCGLLRPLSGQVLFEGKDIFALPASVRAACFAILFQRDQAPGDLLVEDFISTGRFPHRKWHGFLTREDRIAVEEVLELTGLQELKHRPMETLSGGERQKARLAAALAQQPKILFLDEPITFLDPAQQLQVLNLVCRWSERTGSAVIQVLHDINLALRCSSRILAFAEGRMVYDGSPGEFCTQEHLQEVFGLASGYTTSDPAGVPCWIPQGFSIGKDSLQQRGGA